jgi:hypothetical protein
VLIETSIQIVRPADLGSIPTFTGTT